MLESGILRQIEHPNVVRTICEYKGDNGPITILELCVYGSLKDQLCALVDKKEVTAVPEKLAVKILHDLSSGLKAVHDKFIVHGDIKLENVLIDASMEFRVADFGIARYLDEEGMKCEEKILGTTGWYSPEAKKDNILTTASDIFGLGGVMYHVCTLIQRK